MAGTTRIGIFGGTFNPIHNSHIYLAKEYAKRLDLDKMMIVPSYLPPHKSANNLASGEDRLNMCRLATKDLPLFRVSDFELTQGGKSYTYKILRHLKKAYPHSELFLIMGSDMFMTVQDWRKASEIFEIATICAGQREEAELNMLLSHKTELEGNGAKCIVIDLQANPMSSTRVRSLIAAGNCPEDLLHPDVWQYIIDHGLYR